MTSGHIIKKIKTEIQLIHTSNIYLVAVYGFGSFFRSEKAKDCDLLLVVSTDCPNLGLLHAELCNIFLILGDQLSVVFDLTILTEREHQRKPLREHDMLIPISVSLRRRIYK